MTRRLGCFSVNSRPLSHRLTLRNTLLSLSLLALAGCSTTAQKNEAADADTAKEQKEQTEQVIAADQPDIEKMLAEYRPFERNTLFDILAAEMAAKDSRLDITLGNYLKQAHYTKDPGIVARAMRIARYMKAHQATLDAARLWLSIEPTSEEALQVATIELIRIGRFREAMAHIDTLLSQSANINFDFLVKGSKPLTEERREEVISHLSNLLNKYPNHPQLWFTRALLQDQNGNAEAALEDIDQTIFIKKDYINAIVFKSKLLISADNEEEAISLLKNSLSRSPDDKRLRIIYARTLIELKKVKEAQKQFEILVEDNPQDIDLKLSLALISWENGLEEQAIQYLEEIIGAGRKTDEANFYLGQISAKEERLDDAIRYFRQVHNGSFFARANIQIALIQAEQNELEEAIATLTNARVQSPHHGLELFITQADIMTQAGDYEGAHNLLTDALIKYPNDHNILYSRAMIAEKLDRLDWLEADLNMIITSRPNNAMALNALGYTLADRTDRLEEAHDLIQRAVALEPRDPAILDSLGWVYFKQKEYDLAVKYLEKAYNLMPDPEIASHLGEAYWVTGKKEKALEIWNQALETSPDNELVMETMRRLEVENGS